MGQTKDDGERLFALATALADSVAASTDAALLSAALEEGTNADEARSRVQALLKKTVSDFKKRRLQEAATKYERSVEEVGRAKSRIPSSPRDRRRLMEAVLSKQPSIGQVTLQHRSLDKVTDEDVESMLKQLQVLGLLDDETDR